MRLVEAINSVDPTKWVAVAVLIGIGLIAWGVRGRIPGRGKLPP